MGVGEKTGVLKRALGNSSDQPVAISSRMCRYRNPKYECTLTDTYKDWLRCGARSGHTIPSTYWTKNQDILWLGNSNVREIFVAFLCQREQYVTKAEYFWDGQWRDYDWGPPENEKSFHSKDDVMRAFLPDLNLTLTIVVNHC